MSKETQPNAEQFKDAMEQLKAIFKDADEREHTIDPVDVEHAFAYLSAHEGGFVPDTMVENVFYRLGQGTGIAASVISEPIRLILPKSFHAGYANGQAKAQRVYRNTFTTCKEQAAKVKDSFKSTLPTKKVDEKEAPAPAVAGA